MESGKFLSEIQIRVRRFDKTAEIILFGSRARGDSNPESDWDIIILLNSKVDEELKGKIRDELFEVELETDQIISSIIHSKKNWNEMNITPLFQNISIEGIRL